jgi:beta-lactam-binding protein with PASTA domain
MTNFEIPDGPIAVALKPVTANNQTTSQGAATFSVTNKNGSPLNGRLSVVTEGNAKAEWFDIQGEKERTFQGSETQKITVNIKVPGNTPPGDYKLRARVVNVVDPDNDYTNSAVVTVNVPPPAPPKKGGIPWWVWLIVGGVVLLIIIGIVLFIVLSGGKVQVPDVKTGGLTYTVAAQKITDAGLVAQQDPNPGTGAPGTVVTENPDAGASVDKGSTVILTVAGPSAPAQVAVPDVSTQNYTFGVAQGVLIAAQLHAVQQNTAPQGKPPGTVYAQSPAASTQAAVNSNVTLSVDPGVTMSNVVGQPLGSVINSLNTNYTLTVSLNHDGGTTDQIYAQSIANGQVTAKKAPLTVSVHAPVVFHCIACIANVQHVTATQYLQNRSSLMVGH